MADEQKNDGQSGVVADPIERNIDMAIEAQDGKKDDAAVVKEEGDKAAETETDTAKQPDDSKGSSSDKSGEHRPDPEISEAAKKLAGAKDLKVKGPDGQEFVVKGGAERRFYEQRETARHELGIVKKDLDTARQQAQDWENKFKTLESSTQALHGIDPQVLSVGAKIVKDLQSDPVGTLKKMLAEVAAQGYNVQELGATVDTSAILRMIEERLPKDQAKEKTDAELTADASAEVQQFFSTFPDAKIHEPLLARALQDHPDLDLRSVYFAVKSGFADKGFDWSLSLEDNLKAIASDPNADKGDSNKSNIDNKAPLPGGGNAGGNGDQFKMNDKDVAGADMDTGDIVRAAMREHGLKI